MRREDAWLRQYSGMTPDDRTSLGRVRDWEMRLRGWRPRSFPGGIASVTPAPVGIDDNVPFEIRLAEAIAWCAPRADLANPGDSLRSEQLRPRLPDLYE